jgi:hypothetical protein
MLRDDAELRAKIEQVAAARAAGGRKVPDAAGG